MISQFCLRAPLLFLVSLIVTIEKVPLYIVRTVCRMVSFRNPPPQNLLDLGVRVVSFCNFLKLAVRHSHSLQAATGQVCGGEKGARA